MVFCIFLTTPLAFLLLFEGTASFIEASDVQCSANDRLLILCCMLLQLCWPVCMPQFNLMLFAWVLSAVPVVHKVEELFFLSDGAKSSEDVPQAG
ncbi:hypothetical protein AK812_SmicGene288 [Symbiodinium microadriaticum]|uniref:Uncharacterized protein n=1 Tax=Symbiodinium microadriaticum TaxID=2951 RepID=A0A1Q9F6Z1_SYMMI|nr:hypothetical protein AK812_SmicGene288 [Symbiodinium microadriaticum]